jgi:murein DD-endopeptidase MepM/ murein hydrolase activator NlpD
LNNVRRITIIAALLISAALMILVAGQLAIQNNLPAGVVTADIRITSVAKAATPFAPFGPIDPAIIPALQSTPGNRPLAVLPGIQPIGVYLPGIQPRAQLPTFTPVPTIPAATAVPTPTYPPTPSPFPTDQRVEDVGVIQLQNLQMTPNPALVGDNCAPHGLPVDGILTQRFHQYHSGVDLGVPLGTPVLATHSGQVIYAGWSTIGYGWLVIIQNGHYITYYAHNTSFNVAQYQYVKAGQVISFSGSTGNSTGPHVHYETRIDNYPVDPLTFDLRGLPPC